MESCCRLLVENTAAILPRAWSPPLPLGKAWRVNSVFADYNASLSLQPKIGKADALYRAENPVCKGDFSSENSRALFPFFNILYYVLYDTHKLLLNGLIHWLL
ncbi:hypothetical protein JOB18_015121 [Solea senegalensis]|uniref:Uncharacterized protein n=1 Tax=Solea senegalensis TaxID=28829 RepID=A0AAV6Q820_SOLSE|nr:hypothetical protein JOB18_015121 [Solea senegalensis]